MPTNTALIPVPKLENDFYDWYERHDAVLAVKDTFRPEIVMIGDSLTHCWDGPPFPKRTSVSWKRLYGDRPVLNLGFGWDRTQNMLWRLDHGEFDGLAPQTVVVLAGTNNTSTTPNCQANTPEEIVEGILAVCEKIRKISPLSRLVVMAVLPREFQPDTPRRLTIEKINLLLGPAVAQLTNATYLDIGARFLNPDGSLPAELMPDGTHLSEKGYALWADALIAAGV